MDDYFADSCAISPTAFLFLIEVYINGEDEAMVVDADMAVTNGVVHQINEVLDPADNDGDTSGSSSNTSSTAAFIVAIFAIASTFKLA